MRDDFYIAIYGMLIPQLFHKTRKWKIPLSQSIVIINFLQNCRRLRLDTHDGIQFCSPDLWCKLGPTGVLVRRALIDVPFTTTFLMSGVQVLLFITEAEPATAPQSPSSSSTSTTALALSAATEINRASQAQDIEIFQFSRMLFNECHFVLTHVWIFSLWVSILRPEPVWHHAGQKILQLPDFLFCFLKHLASPSASGGNPPF